MFNMKVTKLNFRITCNIYVALGLVLASSRKHWQIVTETVNKSHIYKSCNRPAQPARVCTAYLGLEVYQFRIPMHCYRGRNELLLKIRTKIVVGKSETKRPLERRWHGRADNIKMSLKGILWEDVDWIRVA
jgi:hypothetical protein